MGFGSWYCVSKQKKYISKNYFEQFEHCHYAHAEDIRNNFEELSYGAAWRPGEAGLAALTHRSTPGVFREGL